MPTVGGADGCKRGWVLVIKDLTSGLLSWRLCPTAEELMYLYRPDVLGIDIPIGLPDSGMRQCDVEARLRIGARRSSVFPAPIRTVLCAKTYREACERRFAAEGKRMSQQAWHIVPKIRSVDSLLRRDPSLHGRVREVHPEVCFRILAGRAIEHPKRTRPGQEERTRLLEDHFGPFVSSALLQRSSIGCAVDDLLDAFAACWSAERTWHGQAEVLPAKPPVDSMGLRMEIVA